MAALSVEHVSKEYQLGGLHSALLSDRIAHALLHPRQLLRRQASDRFWALRDVSLEVQPGEVVGVIGRNGAGKSTLLKILSRVTPPTSGRVTVRGRLGALLEVGTGFHPELTGRENVFLNGTILGMTRREISARFDEIVAFSGIERFLDTPVKRYSSGMKVRLAFSVAAHLEPEVLLVDEVLAVGDAEFQRKCIARLEEIGRSGRTILFVSHNLSAVKRMCDRAYLIDAGRIVADGPSGEVVGDYLRSAGAVQREGVATVAPTAERIGNGDAVLTRVELLDEDHQPVDRIGYGDRFAVALTFDVRRATPNAVVELGVASVDGTRILTLQNIDGGRPPLTLEPGTHRVIAGVETGLLPGDYGIDAGLHVLDSQLTLDYLTELLTFTVTNVAGEAREIYPWGEVRGLVRPDSTWEVQQLAPTHNSRAVDEHL